MIYEVLDLLEIEIEIEQGRRKRLLRKVRRKRRLLVMMRTKMKVWLMKLRMKMMKWRKKCPRRQGGRTGRLF